LSIVKADGGSEIWLDILRLLGRCDHDLKFYAHFLKNKEGQIKRMKRLFQYS
jgi:hypothetical protein